MTRCCRAYAADAALTPRRRRASFIAAADTPFAAAVADATFFAAVYTSFAAAAVSVFRFRLPRRRVRPARAEPPAACAPADAPAICQPSPPSRFAPAAPPRRRLILPRDDMPPPPPRRDFSAFVAVPRMCHERPPSMLAAMRASRCRFFFAATPMRCRCRLRRPRRHAAPLRHCDDAVPGFFRRLPI